MSKSGYFDEWFLYGGAPATRGEIILDLDRMMTRGERDAYLMGLRASEHTQDELREFAATALGRALRSAVFQG